MSIPEHISTILPRVLLAVGAPYHPQEAGVGMNTFVPIVPRPSKGAIAAMWEALADNSRISDALHAAYQVDFPKAPEQWRTIQCAVCRKQLAMVTFGPEPVQIGPCAVCAEARELV